jgi:hypothetical protein
LDEIVVLASLFSFLLESLSALVRMGGDVGIWILGNERVLARVNAVGSADADRDEPAKPCLDEYSTFFRSTSAVTSVDESVAVSPVTELEVELSDNDDDML